MKNVLLTGVFVGLACAAAGAQTTRTLIEQALDEPTKITLLNIKLVDAIAKVTEQTGVRIVMPESAMQLVPHGRETLVQEVILENLPLRAALHRLFTPLGMSFVVRDNYVEIVPSPALHRLGRPPSWDEIDTLTYLGRIEPGIDSDARKALAPRIQFRLPIRNAWTILSDAIQQVGAGTGDEVLSIACTNLGWSWTLAEKRIVVSLAQDQIRRRLQNRISVRLSHRPLHDVIQAVGKAAGIRMKSESGTLSSLPLDVQRNFSLTAHNQPTEEVLDSIAAYAGLGYVIEPDGVLFYHPSTPSVRPTIDQQNQTEDPTDPYVARITIQLENGKPAEWLVRSSELPEDLRAMRQRDLNKFFEALRQADTRPKP